MAFLWHDIRDAARALLRTGGYSLVVALTLGLGIGVNTAIFTLVDALILRPLPYADPEQLVRVAEWPRTGGNYTVSPAAYLHWRDRVQAFTRFEARRGAVFAILDGGDAEEMRGAWVTSGYFDLFGVRPLYGRTFSTDDAQPGAACTTVVSHRVWLNRLGGDASVIATPVRFSGRTCTLIGVLPPGTTFDRGPIDVYVPLAFTAADAANNGRMLTVLARLRPERSIDAARDEMVALASAFNATRGEAGRGWTAAVTPLHDVVVGADSRWLAGVLFGAVSVVLAVACLNVAGLALSRTVVRRREIAIRTALGAGRWRVFRYLLVESLLLALAGGLVGVLLGSWGLRVLVSLVPAGLLPPETPPLLDARALLFTCFLALLTGLFFGTVPAWRGTAPNPAEALAAGGRSAGSSSVTTRAHSALLVVEVALAMVLVVAGVSLAVSFVRLTRVEPGFSPEHVLTFRVALGGERYQSGDASARFFDEAIDAIRRIPGVVDAGAVTSLPLGGWLFGTRFEVEGLPGDPARPTAAHIQHVTDGYFEALRIPVVAGRTFTRSDHVRAPQVAIVNETFVKRFAGGRAAIGLRLQLGILGPGGAGEPWEVVGVIRDVKTGGLGDADLATPEIYVPCAQSAMPSMFVAVRTAPGSESRIVPELRAAVRAIDAELPIGTVTPMDQRVGGSVRRERFRTTMICAFAVLALLLSSIGVYAIRSQAVAARIREMGIRLALGASRRQLLRMVLSQGLRQVMTGLTAGLVAAVWFVRFVEPWLFATRATDVSIMAGAALLFGAAALVASWVPARRASAVDPVTLLRCD